MEDGPTRTHTLHTIGSGADTRYAVTGRSTGSGLLDAQHHTAHRTAHEVALYSGVRGDRRRRRRWGTGTGHRTHELTSHPAPGAMACEPKTICLSCGPGVEFFVVFCEREFVLFCVNHKTQRVPGQTASATVYRGRCVCVFSIARFLEVDK